MLLRLDADDPRPLYHQIAAAVRRAIVDGELAPGDRLPPGRDLAEALGVNLATVQHAYRQLAEEGLVVSRVGRGTRIVDTAEQDLVALSEAIQEVVERARRLGIDGQELADMVRVAAS